MSISIKWDITYKCNLNCKHCINGNYLGNINDELTTEEFITVAEKLSHMDIAYIHLLGGEPTARTDFTDILKTFDSYNLNFGFNTNGLKMNDTNLLNYVIDNRHLKNIVFSIEGPNAEINDSIRGKNVFNLITKNMRELIKLKNEAHRDDLVITINTVLSKKNVNYIKQMIEFCLDMGVNEFVLLQFIVKGNAIENNESISFEDELKVVEIIAENYATVKNRLKIVPRFTYPMAKIYSERILKKEFPEIRHMCGAGTNFAFLNNKGELYPCDRYQETIQNNNKTNEINLKNNNFWNIWSKENYSDLFEKSESTYSYKNISTCNTCDFLQKLCFPCPVNLNEGFNEINTSCNRFIKLMKGGCM